MIRTIECGIYILLAALSLSPILSFAKIVVKNKNTLRGLFANVIESYFSFFYFSFMCSWRKKRSFAKVGDTCLTSRASKKDKEDQVEEMIRAMISHNRSIKE